MKGLHSYFTYSKIVVFCRFNVTGTGIYVKNKFVELLLFFTIIDSQNEWMQFNGNWSNASNAFLVRF